VVIVKYNHGIHGSCSGALWYEISGGSGEAAGIICAAISGMLLCRPMLALLVAVHSFIFLPARLCALAMTRLIMLRSQYSTYAAGGREHGELVQLTVHVRLLVRDLILVFVPRAGCSHVSTNADVSTPAASSSGSNVLSHCYHCGSAIRSHSCDPPIQLPLAAGSGPGSAEEDNGTIGDKLGKDGHGCDSRAHPEGTAI
jgi:hypothetical protein